MPISTMRAGVYLGPGQVGLESREIPQPGPGEIRVRVKACGLCGSDLHMVHLPVPFMAPGTTMGHEIAGTVDAIGEGVSGWETGAPVVVEPLHSCGHCDYCLAGRDSICRDFQCYGIHRDGGFSDYVTAPARRVFRFPDALNFRLAALAEPVAVAVHGLRLGGFHPDQRVLVLGAGPIGLAVSAVARAWGAREVLLTARHAHQAEIGKRVGATHVFAEKEASVQALDDVGRQRPIDLVVETVGGKADTLQAACAAVAPGGTVSVLGVFLEPVAVDGLSSFLKETRFQWSNCYSRQPGRVDFEESVRLLREHGASWSSLLTHAVPLDEIGRAFEIAGDKTSGAAKVTVLPEA